MIQTIVKTAHALADVARAPALKYFRSDGLLADNKQADGFDPVTEGDRAVERAIRARLAELRPEDGVIGEEFGKQKGSSGLDWIIDPIDGTRAFLCGAPTWGVLIAAVQGNDVLAGVIDQPFIEERFIGSSDGAFWSKDGQVHALQTRQTSTLSEARLLTTFPEVGRDQDYRGFRGVADQVQLVRYGLDCYGYALLAAGQVDIVIEAGLENYDVAGPIGVVQAAGGVVTTWRGGSATEGGQVAASANPVLHEQVLDLLKPFAN